MFAELTLFWEFVECLQYVTVVVAFACPCVMCYCVILEMWFYVQRYVLHLTVLCIMYPVSSLEKCNTYSA